ncbi:MAG: hypothetical protein EP329_08755 [Deltaproteobacteria bacterium]|nr:MAG: hypothetical protein EP329_08755 [Deltaproteobacteria bacterium]
MKRTVLCSALVGLFAIAASVPAGSALAASPAPTASAAADSADDAAVDTVLAMKYPPRRQYYPRRPPPRRVYTPPRYVPAPRRAVERPYRPLMHFGIGIHGASILDDSEATSNSNFDTGGGFSLDFGWRLGSTFSLDLGLSTSFHDSLSGLETANLTSVTIDGRFFLNDWNQRLQPYLQAGLGAYVLSYDSSDNTYSGPGFQLGGGIDFYLTRGVSIGGKLLYRGAYVERDYYDYNGAYYYSGDTSFVSSFVYGADVKFHF